MRSSQYSPAERDEAVRLATEVGAAEAGRRLGIADGTIRQWCKRAADLSVEVVRSTGRTIDLPPGATWAERQPIIADALAEVAGDVVSMLAESVAEGRAKDARHWALTAAILIDKSRLLAGQAQSISQTETRTVSLAVKVDESTARAEVEALRAEMGMTPVDRGEIVDAEEVDP